MLAMAAISAPHSGGSQGSLYSSRNSATALSDRRSQPRRNSPLTMSSANPSTLVWPDFQNTAAMEKAGYEGHDGIEQGLYTRQGAG